MNRKEKKKMSKPEIVNLDLILPKVPTLTSDDRANLQLISSPDIKCVKDIKVTLASFKEDI